MLFEFIIMRPYLRDQLNKILERLESLSVAKLSIFYTRVTMFRCIRGTRRNTKNFRRSR